MPETKDSAAMTDTELLDALETLIWADRSGYGVVLFPCRYAALDVRMVEVSRLEFGEEYSDYIMGEDLGSAPTLREAIADALKDSGNSGDSEVSGMSETQEERCN